MTTETFAVDMAGWTNDPAADMNWAWQNGNVRVEFLATASPGDVAILRGGAGASGGAFVGDYRASDITIIGFDYLAESVNTSELSIQLHRGTNDVQAFLSGFVSPGTWNRLAVSMVSRSAGSWFPINDEANFEHVLEDVDQVRIRLTRADPFITEVHRLDNIFIDHIHTAGGIDEVAGETAVTWGNLREDWTYRLEATTNLVDAVWVSLGSFTATNAVHSFLDPDMTNFPVRLYRLVIE